MSISAGFNQVVRHINPHAANGTDELPEQIASAHGAKKAADLAELRDWVERLRDAAHTARDVGNITLAKALDMTRFEVQESTLTRSTPTPGPSD